MTIDEKQFPNSYHKDFKDSLGKTFRSNYINKQSHVSACENAVHTSVIVAVCTDNGEKIETLPDAFNCGLKRSRYLPCLGTRQTTNEPFSWLSYFEIDLLITGFGSGLVKMTGYNTDGDSFVGIFGKNSVEWIVSMHASAAYGYIYVPLYATLGNDALQHILKQTKMRIAVCQSSAEASHLMRDFSSMLKHVIICKQDEAGDKLRTECASTFKISYFEEVVAFGQANPQPKVIAKPEDLVSVCYTSGSTGLPKGVMTTNGDMAAGLKRVVAHFEGKFQGQHARHVCYLPLAHIFEQVNINIVLMMGARAGIITNSPESLLADIAQIRPTLLPSVPRILTRVRNEYYRKFPKSTGLQKRLQTLINLKNMQQERGIYAHKSLLDRLFFKKFRKMLGGRISLVVSASAALSPEVLRFFRAALGCPVMEIYGMTELAGAATGLLIGDCSLGSSGAVMADFKIKLRDVPEMGLVASRDNLGEVCVSGPGCTLGYYKDKENTQSLFDDEGYIRTGDIGRWNDKGALEIVDRCKSMFKLAQGEYVAPEKVEGLYSCSSLVRIAMLDGCSLYPFSVLVVLPDFIELRKGLTKLGSVASNAGSAPNESSSLDNLSDEELCRNMQVRRFVLNQLNTIGRERKLKGFELAKNILLTTELFTTENGLLTPTLKLARYKARMHFQADIQRLYAEGELEPRAEV